MFWERKSFGQYKLLFENTIFERVCSKFMIKLSRSKVFLLANILSRAGPCSNYSLLLVTNSTWSWLLKGKTWSLADRTIAKSKQTPLWVCSSCLDQTRLQWRQCLPNSNQFPTHIRAEILETDISFTSAPHYNWVDYNTRRRSVIRYTDTILCWVLFEGLTFVHTHDWIFLQSYYWY